MKGGLAALLVGFADVEAAEGGMLTWTFRLSKPLAESAFWSLQFQPAGGRFAELDTDDVPGDWLRGFGIEPPAPAVPLSELGLFLGIEFAPGTDVTTLSLPVAADGVTEPAEGVVILLEAFEDPVVPERMELTGVVPANP